MSGRDAILQRVREALKVPGAIHRGQYLTMDQAEKSMQAWLPAVGSGFEEQVALFRKQSEVLKTEFIVCDQPRALESHLKEVAQREGWKKIGTHESDLPMKAASSLGLPILSVSADYQVNDLESCSVGITGCDALIAQTGSVLVSAPSAGGRALSVLPPHHVVIARKDQLVPDLSVAFARLKESYSGKWPSFISLITGPSRTGDIERILVLGAHGPRKLTVFLV